MMTDEELALLAVPILDIYEGIEMDLLLDIADRFNTYEEISGSLEWRLKKLDELGGVNKKAVEIFAERSGRTEKAVMEMLEQASIGNFKEDEMNEAYKQGLIKVDPVKALQSPVILRTIKDSFNELTDQLKMINTKAIEGARKSYMDVLNKAFLETSSGIYSYQESVQRAMQELANRGITGATYTRVDKDGEEHTIRYSLEASVRRDVVTAANSTANRGSINMAEDLGYKYVEVSQHLGARVSLTNPIANHAGWQGKVYKIEGSDPGYPNLVKSTGYGLIEGLGGVNCRHRTFPFIPGISIPQGITYGAEENREKREILDKQRAYERKLRKLRKQYMIAKKMEDPVRTPRLKARIDQTSKQLEVFCKKNDLKREFSREQILMKKA